MASGVHIRMHRDRGGRAQPRRDARSILWRDDPGRDSWR